MIIVVTLSLSVTLFLLSVAYGSVVMMGDLSECFKIESSCVPTTCVSHISSLFFLSAHFCDTITNQNNDDSPTDMISVVLLSSLLPFPHP